MHLEPRVKLSESGQYRVRVCHNSMRLISGLPMSRLWRADSARVWWDFQPRFPKAVEELLDVAVVRKPHAKLFSRFLGKVWIESQQRRDFRTRFLPSLQLPIDCGQVDVHPEELRLVPLQGLG